MGRIVVTAFVTLDGVIQAPGLADEDRDGGFELGGWTQPYGDAIVEQRVIDSVLAADALLLGRRTYELFAGYWPHTVPADDRGRKLNAQPKYVVSRTLTDPKWNNTTVLNGDLVDEVTTLKREHAEICVWGSSTLIAPLLEHDLIDEFVLLMYPLVLGSGKRLFPGGHSISFDLTALSTSTTDVTILTYQRNQKG